MDADVLDEKARGIMRANDRGGYTLPTTGLYPYQWNWDSAFAGWGFAEFDLGRAWQELETLMSGQWPNGMVPHILFHRADPGYFPGPDIWGTEGLGPIPSSGISQPPVAASIVRRLHDQNPADSRAAALFPKLKAWHRWFIDWRLDRGAVCVTHPWESGRDNAPDWDGAMAAIDPSGVGTYQRRDTGHVDAAMRPTKDDYDRYIWLVQRARGLGWDEAKMLEDTPFRVADPTMTFILMRANRDLSALGLALGQDTTEIDGWTETLDRGAETLWNPALASYDSRDTRNGAFSQSVSNASFLCWYGGLRDDRMIAQARRIWAAAPYPVASSDPAGAKFDARRYWRGPVWAIMNTMIGIGLEDAGLDDLARPLREATARLIADHGFAEYYNPLDGSPAGGGTFTWTAAVWLRWASPNAGRA